MKLFILLLGVFSMAADSPDLQKYRKEREESLKKNWLVVAGLTWLKDGTNTVGSDSKMDIPLPPRLPKDLGKIVFSNKKATIQFSGARFKDAVVKLDGKVVEGGKAYPLATDKTGESTKVEVGDVQFYLIERPNGVGVRLKDPQAETLKNFSGLNWWPENKKFIVEGKWKPLATPKILRVPDIHGNINDEQVTGFVEMQVAGKTVELYPMRKDDDLFIIFKDPTAGKTSYGTGRFLAATVEPSGRVMVDFNRAYNPPCARIKFATCPMPPAENIIKVPIEAGEKKP